MVNGKKSFYHALQNIFSETIKKIGNFQMVFLYELLTNVQWMNDYIIYTNFSKNASALNELDLIILRLS